VLEGVLLTDEAAGFPNTVIADVSALRLNDGRWRLFFEVGRAVRSAISDDGVMLKMEPGERLASGIIQVRALRLDDGRVRIFFVDQGGIYSAISKNEGLTFTVEPGVRLTATAAGLSTISGPGIVKLSDGRWRMYISEGPGRPTPGEAWPVRKVVSAVSSDLLTWTMDPGVRIGAGAVVSGDANHPSALVNGDGSISLFYNRYFPDNGLLTSTSSDGLTFISEAFILPSAQPLGDPDVVRLPDGGLRVYFGKGEEPFGFDLNSVRRSP